MGHDVITNALSTTAGILGSAAASVPVPVPVPVCAPPIAPMTAAPLKQQSRTTTWLRARRPFWRISRRRSYRTVCEGSDPSHPDSSRPSPPSASDPWPAKYTRSVSTASVAAVCTASSTTPASSGLCRTRQFSAGSPHQRASVSSRPSFAVPAATEGRPRCVGPSYASTPMRTAREAAGSGRGIRRPRARPSPGRRAPDRGSRCSRHRPAARGPGAGPPRRSRPAP